MKIRNGFVSNSSSSSFIVVWDKKPESMQEVKQILFGTSESHMYWDDSFDTNQLAQIIFDDTSELSRNEIAKKQEEQYQYDNWSGRSSWYSKGYKADEALCKKYEKEMDDAHLEEKYWEDVLKKFSDKEKQSFMRKNKLERVLNENSTNERERLFYEATNKLRKARDAQWHSNETLQKLVEDSTNKFMQDFEGKFIAYYHYSDNDGNVQSCLEHSGVFDKLTHWQISHH